MVNPDVLVLTETRVFKHTRQ